MGKLKPVDGTKYYHYREHYVRTGSLRSFGLMMRHYEAAFRDLPPLPEPQGKRRRLSLVGGIVNA